MMIIQRIHSKLLELCVGRSVVVHLFSDGGFGFARELLGMWQESWRSGQTQEGCFFLCSTDPKCVPMVDHRKFSAEFGAFCCFSCQSFFVCAMFLSIIFFLYHVMFTVPR